MGNKLYVGNLAYAVRDEDLQQAFAQFGTVTSAKVMMDRDTGRSKGFGFVEMGSDAEAQSAINGMNGQALVGSRAGRQRGPPARRASGWLRRRWRWPLRRLRRRWWWLRRWRRWPLRWWRRLRWRRWWWLRRRWWRWPLRRWRRLRQRWRWSLRWWWRQLRRWWWQRRWPRRLLIHRSHRIDKTGCASTPFALVGCFLGSRPGLAVQRPGDLGEQLGLAHRRRAGG